MSRKNPEARKEYQREYHKKWYAENKESVLQRNRTHRPARLISAKKCGQRMKAQVFDAYGGYHCSCPGCTEDNPAFMTLDHVDGGGKEHRREVGSTMKGYGLYRWIIRNNYPAIFQVMCWNCNSGRSVNGGVCPHHTYSIEQRMFTCQLPLHRCRLPNSPVAY